MTKYHKYREYRLENGLCPNCGRDKREDRSKCDKCLRECVEYNKRSYSRRKNDVEFKIRKNLRSRVRMAIKRYYKSGSAVRDLGCSIPEFKEYIASKFEQGMTWENWGEWHLDHIKPLSSFNLSDREQFLEAVHHMNLQPLWVEDHQKKTVEDMERAA